MKAAPATATHLERNMARTNTHGRPIQSLCPADGPSPIPEFVIVGPAGAVAPHDAT
jgi:hypothetical protein